MKKHGVSVERIKSVVARHMDITVGELIGERRDYRFVRPRHIAIHLACRLTHNSMPVIGRLFGDRDHSTIFNANWKTVRRRSVDREFDQLVRRIELELDPLPAVEPEVQLDFLVGPLFDRPFAVSQPERIAA